MQLQIGQQSSRLLQQSCKRNFRGNASDRTAPFGSQSFRTYSSNCRCESNPAGVSRGRKQRLSKAASKLQGIRNLLYWRSVDRPLRSPDLQQSEIQSEGNKSAQRQRGILLLNLLVLICAINWVVLKKTEAVLDPSVFCVSRFGVAAIAFWPYFKKVDKEIYRAGIEIGFWAATGYLAQAEGLLTTDASHASFISTLTVIVVPILAGLSGKGVRGLTWLSAIAAFVGVGMLEDGFSMPCKGDMWQLLSAVAFGVQIVRTEHYSNKLKDGTALPLMSVVVTTIAAASLCLTAAEHISEALQWIQHPDQLLASMSVPTWAQVVPVVWSGLMSTDLVLLIEVLALHDVSSTDASIIYTLEPVLGALFAYLLLGERWGPLGWVGAGLIVSSSLFTQLHPDEQ